jgi:S1-C subfamily serine protease
MKCAIIFALIGCNAWVRPSPPPPDLRTPAEQQSYAVIVESHCSNSFEEKHNTGSGVMVSDWQVLTALHVVDCQASIPDIHVTTRNGRWRFSPEKEWRKTDVARIQISSADNLKQRVNPPAIRSSALASFEPVYVQAAWPYADEVIGQSTGYSNAFGGIGYGGTFSYHAQTQPGNSGSGVYDRENRLVGIHIKHADTGVGYASYVTSEMIPR